MVRDVAVVRGVVWPQKGNVFCECRQEHPLGLSDLLKFCLCDLKSLKRGKTLRRTYVCGSPSVLF